ncbi:HPP family protein [Chloroflexota bacterium]
MNIEGFMKKKVVSISENATIAEAARLFVEKHVGILPVVDSQGIPLGVIRLFNLISLELPDFLKLVDDFDFVHDFGAIESTIPEKEVLAQPVTSIMVPIESVGKDCGLMRVFAIMLKNDFIDLAVTNKAGELVGIVSRVDIGAGILSSWPKEQ